MKSLHPRRVSFLAACAATLLLSAAPAAHAADGDLGGNRYNYERFYAGEISAAATYLQAVVQNGQWTNPQDKLRIVDVRDATEHRLGHPEGAIHIPYPRVYQKCKPNPNNQADTVTRSEDGGQCLYGPVPGSAVTQSDEALFLQFEARFPDKNERVALLCRTGLRSVRAGNILANPEKYLGASYAGRGYKQILNIWEGFVGQPKTAIDNGSGRVLGGASDVTSVKLDGGATGYGFAAWNMDLDKDGKITVRDSDGWRYHLGLPYSIKMLPQNVNPVAAQYYEQP